jgi:N-acetylglutamate synthase-like GNAT family acetyltransferase
MDLRIIEHGTAEYEQMIELRLALLRRPLGLLFTTHQLASEKYDILIGAFEGSELIGCCVLTSCDPTTIQLKQMAVKPDKQVKGIGRKIVAFAETVAKEKGYKLLMMHARSTATGFYEKCGYELKGEKFTEVGIPHYYMEKKLV